MLFDNQKANCYYAGNIMAETVIFLAQHMPLSGEPDIVEVPGKENETPVLPRSPMHEPFPDPTPVPSEPQRIEQPSTPAPVLVPTSRR